MRYLQNKSKKGRNVNCVNLQIKKAKRNTVRNAQRSSDKSDIIDVLSATLPLVHRQIQK